LVFGQGLEARVGTHFQTVKGLKKRSQFWGPIPFQSKDPVYFQNQGL